MTLSKGSTKRPTSYEWKTTLKEDQGNSQEVKDNALQLEGLLSENHQSISFDEPLSNLDAELRVATRVELKALHARLGNTMIYVTHDQVEAMTMADKIVVMHDGIIEQTGSPFRFI